MLSGLTGQRPRFSAVTRADCWPSAWCSSAGLSACTTVEGTNAMVDVGTFEREVAIESMKGMGMLEREGKDENIAPRGPLVMPKSRLAAARRRPSTAVAALPPGFGHRHPSTAPASPMREAKRLSKRASSMASRPAAARSPRPRSSS